MKFQEPALQEVVRQPEEQRFVIQVSMRDLVAPLFRRRRLFIVSFLVVALGTIVTVLLLPKQYEAEMKILVKRERIDPTMTTDKATVVEPHSDVTEEQVQSEVELLQSRDLLENVVKNAGLVHADGAKSDHASAVSLALAVRSLGSKLRIEPIRKTNVISATYRSNDPVLAARVLNELANLFLEKHLAVHRLPGAFDFFQKQTERYRDELEKDEETLVAFGRETGLVSPELEKDITLHKLSDFEVAYRETQAGIAETSDRIRSLESQMSSTHPRITTQERTSENPMLFQQLKSTLLNLQLKHTELTTKYATNYPLVQEVEKQIKQTEAAIAAAEQTPLHDTTTDSDPTYTWLREELAKSHAQLIALRARAAALAPVVEAYQTRTQTLDEKGARQQDLVRAAKAAEENYLLYLQKQEEARISDALDQNRMLNVAIAEPATVPALPVRSAKLTLLLGVLLATLLSVGIAFGADFLDPSFRTPRELNAILQIPVLAAIPREMR
jgi:polysaccharide chain length determinant protein (PEP-CTERM system associated)